MTRIFESTAVKDINKQITTALYSVGWTLQNQGVDPARFHFVTLGTIYAQAVNSGHLKNGVFPEGMIKPSELRDLADSILKEAGIGWVTWSEEYAEVINEMVPTIIYAARKLVYEAVLLPANTSADLQLRFAAFVREREVRALSALKQQAITDIFSVEPTVWSRISNFVGGKGNYRQIADSKFREGIRAVSAKWAAPFANEIISEYDELPDDIASDLKTLMERAAARLEGGLLLEVEEGLEHLRQPSHAAFAA